MSGKNMHNYYINIDGDKYFLSLGCQKKDDEYVVFCSLEKEDDWKYEIRQDNKKQRGSIFEQICCIKPMLNPLANSKDIILKKALMIVAEITRKKLKESHIRSAFVQGNYGIERN